MSYEEELVFGLNRWINKTISYLNNKSSDEFFNDDKTFDACCYCLLVISEIGEKLKDIKEVKDKYKNVNFNEISLIYSKCLDGDNINLSLIYEVISKAFPALLNELNK